MALTSKLTAVADAIREKTGKEGKMTLDQMPSEIAAIPAGGDSEAPFNDVNFRDYDGTVVASYTADDFAALSAMPGNPSHEGLTAQGWNWSLADAKAHVAKYGMLEVGQMYITDDGKTRFHVDIASDYAAAGVKLCVGMNNYQDASTMTVDWGDGETTTWGATDETPRDDYGSATYTHDYPGKGRYVISVSGHECDLDVGSSGNWNVLSGSSLVRLTEVNIGDNVSRIGQKAFQNCRWLEKASMPSGLRYIEQYAFSETSVRHLTVPSGAESVGYGSLSGSYLSSVSLPNTLEYAEGGLFGNSYVLRRVTFPDSVISLGAYLFGGCHGVDDVAVPDSVQVISSGVIDSSFMTVARVYPANPPEIRDGDLVGGGNPVDLYVPDGSVDAYRAAAGWSAYADRIRPLSEAPGRGAA